MKEILVLGAGRSSSVLISYLLKNAQQWRWKIKVGDVSLSAAQERVGNTLYGTAVEFSIQQEPLCDSLISTCDVVISLLPAHLHIIVARYCLKWKKHLLTASYVSEEMKLLDAEVRANGLLFLNECGLDPGIDHMSAMKIIDSIKNSSGNLISFESFTGGLIAPETDVENPWRYKFTWNPRNVVLAGQGTARFLQDGKFKYIPYQQLFKRTTDVHIDGYGGFEGYANRDSLKYIDTYGLQGIKTMLRGTLRHKGYCGAWNVLVQLGCCDDTYNLDDVASMTHADFIETFLPAGTETIESRIAVMLNIEPNGEEMERLQWSGFFRDAKIGLNIGTPAQITEHILNKRWALQPQDKDFIMMWHRFGYEAEGRYKEIHAYLTVTGEDSAHTAMAKTVGLPLAIATKLLLQGKVSSNGVVIPVQASLYEPILDELKALGIALVEKWVTVKN